MSSSRFSGRILSFVLLTILMIASGTALAQNTINVPADQPTIQAGINAANNGDTVLVAPGTYVENLNFNGKAITVTSSGGAAVTIVDGNAKAAVATFVNNEGNNSVLNGFTLRNGVPNNSPPIFVSGGGIVIYNASPTITDNVITGNHAVSGIGIEAQDSSAVIRGNTITGNTQGGGDGGSGGGIEVLGGAPQIIGNTITNNSMLGGGDGGGIGVNGASATIQNNYIAGNSVYNDGGGIAIVNGGSLVMVQNIIVNNSSGLGGSGGGIFMVTPADETAVIANNTIAGNTANAFDNTSGLYVGVFGPATISNNIVVAAPGQNAIVCEAISTFPVFSHNDVVASSGGQAWSSNCASFASSNGDISADPQFVDAAHGNYHLQAGSPAVDGGDNTAPNLPQQDYDGNPRVLDGNNDCVSTVDLGVYELFGGAANASFSSGSLTFSGQVVGTSSSPQSVVLTNTGVGCFQFTSTQITGDFSQANTCSARGVPGGSSCAYNVTFTPTTSGIRTGALTVTGTDGINASSPNVSLSGVGQVVPVASVVPNILNFGSVAIGSTVTSPVSLTNTGQATLNISSVNVTPPFSEVSTNCPASLAAGASCSFIVAFTPLSTGFQSGSLTITDNASGSPQTVSLSGTGLTPPTGSLSTNSLNFGSQVVGTGSAQQTVTLTNNGQASLSIAAITVSGPFFEASSSCPSTLAGGASCVVGLGFAPSVAGAQAGALIFTDNAAGSPQTVALNGTGVDFSVSTSPNSATVKHGSSAQFTIQVNPAGGAFTPGVSLSCSNLPATATCTLSPASVVPGANGAVSLLKVSLSAKTPHETFNVVVTGQSGSLQHSSTIFLTVD